MPSTKELLKALKRNHVPMKTTKAGYLVKTPDGYIVTVHNTPSDRRAMMNMITRFKRHGLDIESILKG